MKNRAVRCGALVGAFLFWGSLWWGAPQAHAQAQVLVLACPPGAETIAGQLNAQVDHQLTATWGDISQSWTLEQWNAYDALLVSTDGCFAGVDRAAFGDLLASYVDGGRGVVEASFSQQTGLNPSGRWNQERYNVVPTNNNNIFSSASMGTVLTPAHPIVQGVEQITINNFRTGSVSALPGATVAIQYQDGQILAAWREDKPGRVAWLGFSPASDTFNSGDTTRLMANEVAWVADANSAPVLVTPADQLSPEGQAISLQVVATDADQDDVLTWTAQGLPPGLSLNGDGLIQGQISYEAAANSPYSVTVMVTDGQAARQASFGWVVTDVNRAPTFPNPGDQTSAEGSNVSVTFQASDPDGDAITFSASGLPPGLSLEGQSGQVTGALGFGLAANSPYQVTVRVTDGALQTQRTFFWRITNTNQPPVLGNLGPFTVAEGQPLVVALEATDPDNDAVSFSIPELPTGAVLDPNNWTLRWTPGFEQAGAYQLQVTATDTGMLTDTGTLQITVTNTNQAPVFAPVPALTVGEGQTLEWTVGASDPDGDALTFSARELPTGATLDPGTGALRWQAPFGQVGAVSFTVVASDGTLSSEQLVTVTVTGAPDAPVVTSPQPQQRISQASPTVQGESSPGFLVEIYLDEVLACTAVVSMEGDFSCDAGLVLVDGAHVLTALAINPEGVRGQPGDAVPFVVDTVAPAAPQIQAPGQGDVVGSATPQIRGAAPADALSVSVWREDVRLCQAQVQPDLSWSCQVEAPLSEGSARVLARARDEAGNESLPSEAVTFQIDLTAPLPPRIDSPQASSQLPEERPAFSGVADPGSLVQVLVDDSPELGCQAQAEPQGAWSCLGAALEAGPHTASAVALDAAGNRSPPSAPVSFLIDLNGPDRPFIASPGDGDFLNTEAPLFQGSGEAGSLVRVRAGGTQVCMAVLVSPTGDWSCRSTENLPDGEYVLVAIAQDEFARDSEPSPTLQITIDTEAPGAPVLQAPAANTAVTATRPQLAGQAEASSRVQVFLQADMSLVCAATADEQGRFSCQAQADFSDGPVVVLATATDAAQNESAPSAPHRFLVDTDGDADNDGIPDVWEQREGFDPLDPGDADDDPDEDGLTVLQEYRADTAPRDGDTDDDGVLDGAEPSWDGDADGDGLIQARDPDSDNDGLLDGTELGVLSPTRFTDASRGFFVADADPASNTDPLLRDSDGGGAEDGAEDRDLNGRLDVGELDPTDDGDDLFQAGPDDLDLLLDSDEDGLTDLLERHLGLDPMDADTDDDGLLDGAEPNPSLDMDGDGLSSGLDPDSDNDGLPDGLEARVAELPLGTDASRGRFMPDLRPASGTGVLLADSDRDGLRDGLEDTNRNGRADSGESDPNDAADRLTWLDTDGDGLGDDEETFLGLPINDGDSDDDGLLDGDEPNFWDDQDGDGLPNALDSDSDEDGVLDGTESGVTEPTQDTDTSQGDFVADVDPNSRTWMLLPDSDGDGLSDGEEDLNANGRLEGDETDPLDPLDPEVVRCDFDFQCVDALGEGHFCDTDTRTCQEGEAPPECVTDMDCELEFGEDFYCEPASQSCQRRPEEENNGDANNGDANNANNGDQEPDEDLGVADKEEGCGCSSVAAPAQGRPAWLGLLLLGALLLLRRR